MLAGDFGAAEHLDHPAVELDHDSAKDKFVHARIIPIPRGPGELKSHSIQARVPKVRHERAATSAANRSAVVNTPSSRAP